MNSKHWKKYYKKSHDNTPSSFAQETIKWMGNAKKIIDFGCGNGRDSYFFGKQGLSVLGIDRAYKPKNTKKVKFIQQDIRKFIKKRVDTFDVKYCRFFFSSVEDDAIDSLLTWVRQGIILIEARDKSDKSFENDHERNLQHYPTLLQKLGKNGFTIIEKQVSQGLAIKGKQDPMIIRIAAHKDNLFNKK